MIVDSATNAAFERIAQRAADVRMAFTPGAVPAHGDVFTEKPAATFTLDPLSIAPPENAYFITTDDRNRTCYTRDGSIALSEGSICASDGRPLQGFANAHASLAALRVDPLDDALGRVKALHVEADGTVTYQRDVVDPRSGTRESERVVVGRLALARFAAGTKLLSLDANHVAAPADVPPHVGRPGDGNFEAVTPFARESSRVDLEKSLQKLKEAYLAFDALSAAHAAQGHANKTAMDLLK